MAPRVSAIPHVLSHGGGWPLEDTDEETVATAVCAAVADPDELERRIEEVLGTQEPWVWGGGAAAIRLTQFYRGPETVLHVPRWRAEFPKQLKALKAHDGPLVVLRPLGQLALEGAAPRTAHPLMVYTELLTTGDPRAREAAAEIQRTYLTQ